MYGLFTREYPFDAIEGETRFDSILVVLRDDGPEYNPVIDDFQCYDEKKIPIHTGISLKEIYDTYITRDIEDDFMEYYMMYRMER